MLSPFPELLSWSWYVPLLFRPFLALYLINLGYGFALKGDAAPGGDKVVWAIFGGMLILIGALFFIGLFVQIAGAIGFSLAMTALALKKHRPMLVPESRMYYLLVGLVSLSLVFLGAGPFAYDLPL
jgi:hypothetical protein